MRRIIILFLIIWPAQALFSQALTSINFRDLYNPDGEVSIILQPVRTAKNLEVYYQIQTNPLPLEKYDITWEKRDSYTQRNGTLLINSDTIDFRKSKKGIMDF